MTNDVEHLFMWLLAIHISSVKCVFKYFAHFLIGLFYYWAVRVLCIVSIQISYQINDMQIFEVQFFILVKSNLFFYFMDYAIGVISKTSCLPEAHKDFFLLCFLLKVL